MKPEPDQVHRVSEAITIANALHVGFMAHHAIVSIGAHPQAKDHLPPVEPGQLVPLLRIGSDDQAPLEFDWGTLLELAQRPEVRNTFSAVWTAGALITFGDALHRQDYFDKAPILEMVRHLRHAVAHGNRFQIRDGKRNSFPAHTETSEPPLSRADGTHFRITRDLNGQPCLFDFISMSEVMGIIQAAANHLRHIPGQAHA